MICFLLYTSRKLEAFAEFPGSELGNEYKNKKGQVDWIFTAVRVGETDNENISGGKEINEGNIDSNKNNIKDIITFVYFLTT